METEEEAREAADEKEVQVEAVDIQPFHTHTHLDSKNSSVEIKNVAETIDSTERTLKIPEDQVLVDAPSEHNLNGTSSSLNSHMDEENKISNEQLHKDSKKEHEQVEAVESAGQNNKEASDCLSHGETTIEDCGLLKHANEEEPKGDDHQDDDPMPDTLKSNSDMDQSKHVDQLDHNMDPAKANEDTQPASMENIPNAEVVTEAHAEDQSPLGRNLDDSDAILDTVDRSTEAAIEDSAIHLEHKESFPDDTSTAKHIEEVVKVEEQHSSQADAIDEVAVQEDIPKGEETGVPEERPKSEHADVSTIVAQEVLQQEPSADTNGSAYEKNEQTSQQSSMAASDDRTSEHNSTTCEPSVDIQVQNKKYADAVDTDAAMQATPHQLNTDHQEEKATEETITSEPQTLEPESVEKMNDTEATKPQDICQESNISPSEKSVPEKITKEDIVTIEPDGGHQQPQESGLVDVDDIETTKSKEITSGLHQESSIVCNYEESSSEDNVTVREPNTETQENLLSAEVGDTENVKGHDAPQDENVETEATISISPVQELALKQELVEDKCTDTTEKSSETQQNIDPASEDQGPACKTPLQNITAQGIKDSDDAQTDQLPNLDSFPAPGEATKESKLPRIDPTFDVQEVQELDSTEQTRGLAMEIEDHQQHRVSTIEEPAVDNKPVIDDYHVHEEKAAELKYNEAMEAEAVLEQSNISTPDNAAEEKSEVGNDPDCSVHPAQQVESSRDSEDEDSKLLKEEETSDKKAITIEDTATKNNVEDETDPPVGMEQEQEQKSVETSDTEEVQELGYTEPTRSIEAMETEDKQQHKVSTLEETTVDKKANVDDHQLHEEKPAELKDNEAVEAEQILEQSNIRTPDNAPEERSELVESSRDSEDSKLLKEEETSDQKIVTLEDTATKDIVEDEIDAHVGVEQEHEQKSVEEVKDISANEVKENFHASQPDAFDKLASESNTTLIEPTYGIQHLNDFETEEMKSIEGINDRNISCEQIEIAASADPSPTDNETAPQEHPAESHEENLGNETENAMLAHGIKYEIQTSAEEQKDDAFHFSESIPTTEKSKNLVDEDVTQSSGEDTLESSNTTNQMKEGEKAGTEHNSSQKSSENHGESIPHVKDKDIDREPVTESGTAEASQALIENDAKASQDVTEKDETMESGEPTNEHRKAGDAEYQPQTCDSSVDAEAAQKVSLDEQHKQDEAIESQKEQPQTDEQKHKDEGDDVIVESKNIENGNANRTEETDTLEAGQSEAVFNETLKTEQTLHTSEDSYPNITDISVEDITEIDKGVEEENIPNIADTSNVDAQMDKQEDQENTGKDNILPTESTSGQNETANEITNEEVENEKLESTVDNDVELEATQQKVDTSNVDTNNGDQLSISNSFTKHETESADDALQFKTAGNTFDKADETISYEKAEESIASVPEIVTLNEKICDKVTGAEEGLSDETLKNSDDTSRNFDASSVDIESNEESRNAQMEEHKLAASAHPTMDENTPKQEISVSEKSLPTEPEEQEDDPIHKKQDEDGMHEPDIDDDQNEVEQDLPVSNFLMNLILGKENSEANGHSEPEAETKQEETRGDNSLIIPKQVESSALSPIENNVEDKFVVEQETKDVNCPEEKHEVVEEQSHDLKLGTETSLENDVEINKNSHNLELSPYQDTVQDTISNEILSEAAAEAFTKMEDKDTGIPNKQDDREVDTISQEHTEAATQNETGSFENNLDDLNNPKNLDDSNNTKTPEENTLGEGQTRLLPECLNEARSVNSVTEQTLPLTESGMTDAKSLPSKADNVPNPVSEIQDKTLESSSIRAAIISDIQVESEEDKTKEKQPTTTARDEVAEEHVEISNDNPQKSIDPEETSNEQEPQIVEQVSDTEIAVGHEKEISEGSSSTFMNKKEDSNVSVSSENNIQTDVEIQADGSSMQINQDKLEDADNKTDIESEKQEESNIQEKQGNGTEEQSPKECDEEDQQLLVKKETVIKEEDTHEADKNHTETVKIEANDEQELSDSKVQERDLDVFSPKDVHESEESFVDVAKPEFSTDEEQSPRADESNMSEQKTYEGKTNDEERIKNFNDEEVKTEAQVAGQKAEHKKQTLLSGVGSKVKQQLAKVKKAITGKAGHIKPKSPKA